MEEKRMTRQPRAARIWEDRAEHRAYLVVGVKAPSLPFELIRGKLLLPRALRMMENGLDCEETLGQRGDGGRGAKPHAHTC